MRGISLSIASLSCSHSNFRCSLRPDLGYVQGTLSKYAFCSLKFQQSTFGRNVVYWNDAPHQYGRIRIVCMPWKLTAAPLFCTFYRHGCSSNVLAVEMCVHIASARVAHFKCPFYRSGIFYRFVSNELVTVLLHGFSKGSL
jgi:hypothetical protein